MNIVAILVSALVGFIVGFLLHGPILGKVWMNNLSLTWPAPRPSCRVKCREPSSSDLEIKIVVIKIVIPVFPGPICTFIIEKNKQMQVREVFHETLRYVMNKIQYLNLELTIFLLHTFAEPL